MFTVSKLTVGLILNVGERSLAFKKLSLIIIFLLRLTQGGEYLLIL